MSSFLPRRESGRGQYSTARSNNSCQLSAEFTVEFENKFPSCKLGGCLGIWGHYWALKQNQALYLGFYLQYFSP